MKVFFIGTVVFSYKSLEKLIQLNVNIVGVCTKEKSLFNADYADLTSLCESNNIPYKYIDNINSKDNIEWIYSLHPDIIFCFGWSSLIKKELLELAPLGVVGFHPTALPRNRGRHPLIWALVLGLRESSSTFFFMKEGADDGDILSQVEFTISYEDDASTLYTKVIDTAMNQIEVFIPQLDKKQYKRIAQNHLLSNTWRKRNKVDGIIDFRMNSEAIYNLVRGLTRPYVGASINYNNIDIIIWKVKVAIVGLQNIEYGKVLEVKNNTILVKTYDEAVRIIEHEFKVLPRVGEYL